MKPTVFLIFLIWVSFTGGLAVISHSLADEPALELELERLLTTQLEGVEGTDIIVSRVTIPPNTEMPWHWHPGEEFAYMLEGSTVLRLKGEPDQAFGAGEIAKVPFRHVHKAATGDEGATILVFRIHERGAPERIVVE